MSGGDAGRLYVCAVPIGNLEDASPRLRRILGEVDAIACEDTRVTGKLLELLGIRPAPRLLAHHDHNERAGAQGIVALLERGEDVALVSDAGSPVVSDPGAHLARAAHDAGIEVVAVPGPSAVAAALGVAGMAGTRWRFVGFLPRGRSELEELARAGAYETLVAFESPHRIAASLEALAQAQPEREVAVCRELTKRYEQVVRGTLAMVAPAVADGETRGEYVVVLGPLASEPPHERPDARATALVRTLVEEGVRRKRACAIAAEVYGGSAGVLYDASLAGES